MPNELKHSKKGLINIQNDDNKCFLWCHVRHLDLIDKSPQRITKEGKEFVDKLNYEGINFPVSKKDYDKIEIQNRICTNRFCYENKIVDAVYLSDQTFDDSMDLLLILGHYVYIKNFDRLMFNKTKNKNKKYFCKNWLYCLSSKNVLIEHKRDCLVISRRVMKKYFNSNLIMSAEKNEKFEMTNICWICDGLIENTDNKVRDHCHITGRYRGTAHYGCNINLKITKKFL